MRHSIYGKHLGRDKNQRTALFRGLVRSLILYGHIHTTETKAKAIKGLFDKLVTASKKDTEAGKRVVQSFLPQKAINQRLLNDIAPKFKDRNSGFTKTVKLGRRLGDQAMMVEMKIVDSNKVTVDSQEEVKSTKKVKKEQDVNK